MITDKKSLLLPLLMLLSTHISYQASRQLLRTPTPLLRTFAEYSNPTQTMRSISSLTTPSTPGSTNYKTYKLLPNKTFTTTPPHQTLNTTPQLNSQQFNQQNNQQRSSWWARILAGAGITGLASYFALQQSPVLAEEEKQQELTSFKSPVPSRDQGLQEAIDENFEDQKNVNPDWLMSGSIGLYGLLKVDEKKIVMHLIKEHPEQTDFYFIDVGSGKGRWGKELAAFIQQQPELKNKRFHIFSLTGGLESKSKTLSFGKNITIHQINQFKIENIDEELAKRGFDLTNKVDFIASRWTLRHLVDPFGTLERMYSLLKPAQGMLASTGFLLSENGKIQRFPLSLKEPILIQSNATVLFNNNDSNRNSGNFFLQRPDTQLLKLPIKFSGTFEPVDYNYQVGSYKVMNIIDRSVKPKAPINFQTYRHFFTGDDSNYCLQEDQKCFELYKYLKDNNLFYQEPNDGELDEE